MKNIKYVIFGLMSAWLFASPALNAKNVGQAGRFDYGTQPGCYHRAMLSAHQYQQMRADRDRIEVELLSELDKEGRQLYHGMNQEGQDLALELASRSIFSSKAQALNLALRKMDEKVSNEQRHLLQNGMDRIANNQNTKDAEASETY